MSKVRLIETDDGSHSLYNPDLKETYHSTHGAINESTHVFIKNGIQKFYRQSGSNLIYIFEVGFGTGLNALLTWKWSEENKVKVVYHSIEEFPLGNNIIAKINYGEKLEMQPQFNLLHQSSWDKSVSLSEYFTLKKIKDSWNTYQSADSYDTIFYDAFAPSKQPDMWAEELIKKCYDHLSHQGTFVTYCAKGQLKRDLIKFGMNVETLPGPPGKKEMVRATK